MQKGMKRIARISLGRVLPHIGEKDFKIRVQHQEYGSWRNYKVKMTDSRMRLFGREQKWACCGLNGQYFWLEHSGCFPPHFNLYGVNRHGHEVMLTMDHIEPKSKGGKTEPENLQVLCQRCNKIKKHLPLTLDQLRKRAGIDIIFT